MKNRNSTKAISSSTVVGILVVAAIIAGFAYLLVHQANFLVGRSLQVAFGSAAPPTYKRAWFSLEGALVAKDVTFRPDDPEAGRTLIFKRVRIETPGWAWVLGSLRNGKEITGADRLHVRLDGGSSDAGIDPSFGTFGPFTANTASPFEAEGCVKDRNWMRSELSDMGLSPGPTSLEFDIRAEGGKLASRITLETPGVSKLSFVRHELVSGTINPYLPDSSQSAVTDEHWLVEDQGFVKARNKYCAGRDGLSEGDFVFRHVDAVKRLLAIRGLQLDEASFAAYAGFARNGGQLGFGGPYAKPQKGESFAELRSTGAAFPGMAGVLERDDRKIVAQWSRIPPKPLEGADTLATFAAMMKEEGIELPAAPATAAAPATVGSSVGVTTPSAVAVASAPTPQAAGTGLAAASAKRGDKLAWEDLPRFVGHDIEITTVHISTRAVTILEAGEKEVLVEGSIQGGHVQLRINRDGFLRAGFIR